jgi:hypothetical protein
VANLPPVSTTPAVPVAQFAIGIVDTHGINLPLRENWKNFWNDPNVIFMGLEEDKL